MPLVDYLGEKIKQYYFHKNVEIRTPLAVSGLEETIVSLEAAVSPPLTRGCGLLFLKRKKGRMDLVSH